MNEVAPHRAPTALGAAWRFLTRVPIGRADADHAVMATAPSWFPVVGAMLGLVTGAVFAGASWLVGPLAGAAVAIAVGALVTGGFHHDGLADMADGFGGGWDRAQRLSIMKDSRHGTYGVLALVCIVVVQVASLASLDRVQGVTVLVVAHCGARAASVALLRVAPRPTAEGLAADASRDFAASSALAAAAVGVVVTVALLGAWGVVVLAALGVSAGAVALLAHRKIGGVTGDVLGAAEQVGETAVLLCGAAFARHVTHWPWWR